MKSVDLIERPDTWVVSDDPMCRVRLADFLGSRGYGVVSIRSREELLSQLSSSDKLPPSLLILDFQGSHAGELDLLRQVTREGRRLPAIILSSVGKVSIITEAMRLGASDYLMKPFEEHELEAAIKRIIAENSASGTIPLAVDPAASIFALASANNRMLQIRAICNQVARTDVPVLILVESGVGKEVLARYIHAQSRPRERFLKVNCAALPTDLLESELFGHERGAFTGAQREKPGKFELAAKGTIMLDEIAEMSSLLQAKLLHVLQDGEYTRLGATRTLRSEARIIAATNKKLHTLVGCGEFREDLYFRLNVITIEVPPLRDRPEDIRALCAYFVGQYRTKYKSPVKELPEELLEAFSRYHWPGNIRQLENSVRRFLILPDVEETLTTLNDAAVIPADPAACAAPAVVGASLKALSASAAEKAEKEMILRTLAEVNWNRKQAAQRLDICYKSLLIKLRRWQLGRRNELRTGESEKAWESGRKPVARSASWKARPAAVAHPNDQGRAARSGH
jgi:two-component system response regulator AtoC